MHIKRDVGIVFAITLLAKAAWAAPEAVFDNTVGAPVVGLNIATGQTLADDATLGGSSREIISLEIPFVYSNVLGLDMSADVTAYLYDVGVGGLPGAVLYSGTQTSVLFPNGLGPVNNLVFSVPNIVVPDTLRWGVSVANLVNVTALDIFGPQLGSTTSLPAGSSNYAGSGLPLGGGVYLKLLPLGSFEPTDILLAPDVLAVTITANNVVPEPSSMAMFCLAGILLRVVRRPR